jgi:hypothetical protein
MESQNPHRRIGIQEFAQVVGVAVSTIRRRLDAKSKYYDPRIPQPRRDGIVQVWYLYEAVNYRNAILGPPQTPEAA